jgi:membrane protein
LKEKLKSIPVVKNLIGFLEALKIPGYVGFSFYDLIEMYTAGIVQGALSSRAGSIAFSFFMALFPFLLFILNLIAFIPIANFDAVLFDFIELLLPARESRVFYGYFYRHPTKTTDWTPFLRFYIVYFPYRKWCKFNFLQL